MLVTRVYFVFCSFSQQKFALVVLLVIRVVIPFLWILWYKSKMDKYNIKGNIFGGLTAGVIALPLALAFGAASGLGAAAGLYGAIIVCLFAVIFGGTPTQISGPTGPMTVVIASIAALYSGNVKIVFGAIMLAGIFQILLGLSKVGRYIKYVPYPVISGFMSGIGVIIILLQLNPLLGFESLGSTIDAIWGLFSSVKNLNPQSLILGVLTLFIVFFTPKKITKKVPAALIALIFVTILSVAFGFDVKVIGDIPSTLPKIQLGMISVKEFFDIVPVAATLALLGAIDSLLTSLVADSITKTKHDSNRELVGQGIGNFAAGLFGGIAGAGATMRTVVNVNSGATGRLSGVVHSLFLIMVVLFLAPYAAQIPLAVLSGILVKVGFDIIDYKFIKIIKAAPKSDIIVMLVVFLITVFDDLIFSFGSGIVLSSLLFAVYIAKQFDVKFKEAHSAGENDCDIEKDGNILLVRIKGIFFFGSASQLLSRLEEVMDRECIIIDCQTIKTMDISAVFALEEMILRLQDKKIKVVLLLNNRKLAAKMLRQGLIKVISRNNIVYDENTAVKKAAAFCRAV